MQFQEKIQNAIEQTILDINQWHQVLELLVKASGASKGLISLRDRHTAELVVPTDVRQELGSPLVYGFSEQEVYSYISHYIDYDPWTKIENIYHPQNPYPLSKYIDKEDLLKHVFWEWLAPQNISDTIISKIGTSADYWIAINLYYPVEETTIKQYILDYLSEFRVSIQKAWKLGQNVRMAILKSTHLDYFMEQQPHPSFLITNDRVILAHNCKADQLLKKTNSGFFITPDQKLRPKNIQQQEQLEFAIHSLKENPDVRENSSPSEVIFDKILVKIFLIGKTENLLGENTAQYMLSMHDLSDYRLIWEHPDLTPREQQLVEILAKGKRVVDFQIHCNIKKSTAHMHWTHVKEKLGVKDRAEIQELYLKSQLPSSSRKK